MDKDQQQQNITYQSLKNKEIKQITANFNSEKQSDKNASPTSVAHFSEMNRSKPKQQISQSVRESFQNKSSQYKDSTLNQNNASESDQQHYFDQESSSEKKDPLNVMNLLKKQGYKYISKKAKTTGKSSPNNNIYQSQKPSKFKSSQTKMGSLEREKQKNKDKQLQIFNENIDIELVESLKPRLSNNYIDLQNTEQDEILDTCHGGAVFTEREVLKSNSKGITIQRKPEKPIQNAHNSSLGFTQSLKNQKNVCIFCERKIEDIKAKDVKKCTECYEIAHEQCYQTLYKKTKNQPWQCKYCLEKKWHKLVSKYQTMKNWFMYRVRVLIACTQFYTFQPHQRKLIKYLINDKAYIKEKKEKIAFMPQDIFARFPIISPSSKLVNLWHFIILLSIIFKVFEIPLVISFDLQEYVSLYYEIPLLVIFILEILFSFNIGFFQEGIVIMNRKKIRKRYIKGLVFFVAHFLACGFHYTAWREFKKDPNVKTWLVQYEYQNQPSQERYVHSLYFSFISMSTIGYGDISPQTQNERIYIMFSTLISCGIFAYSLNIVTQIFQDLAEKMQSFKKSKSNILSYMRHRQVNNELQIRVIKNLEHKFQMEELGLTKSSEILNELSIGLVRDIKKDFYLRILKEHIIFKANFSDIFLSELSVQMEEQTLAPDEILYKEGEMATRLYFIFKGGVQLYTQNSVGDNIVLGNVKEGKILGTKTFFTQYVRQNSAKSSQISQLIYLSREQFIETIKQYPADYERYLELQDSLKLEQDHSLNYNYESCAFCQKQGHMISICPFLHLHVDKKWHLHKKMKKERMNHCQQRHQLPYKWGQGRNAAIIQKRKNFKYYSFYNIEEQKNNFQEKRNDALFIRKKYVLQHLANLEHFFKNPMLPLDFYFSISQQNEIKYISEYMNENLSDEEFFNAIPGIVISQKIEMKKQEKEIEKIMAMKIQPKKHPQYYSIIQDFDYNLQRDQTLILLQFCELYNKAKQELYQSKQFTDSMDTNTPTNAYINYIRQGSDSDFKPRIPSHPYPLMSKPKTELLHFEDEDEMVEEQYNSPNLNTENSNITFAASFKPMNLMSDSLVPNFNSSGGFNDKNNNNRSNIIDIGQQDNGNQQNFNNNNNAQQQQQQHMESISEQSSVEIDTPELGGGKKSKRDSQVYKKTPSFSQMPVKKTVTHRLSNYYIQQQTQYKPSLSLKMSPGGSLGIQFSNKIPSSNTIYNTDSSGMIYQNSNKNLEYNAFIPSEIPLTNNYNNYINSKSHRISNGDIINSNNIGMYPVFDYDRSNDQHDRCYCPNSNSRFWVKFDQMRIFKKYFSNHNYPKVIENYERWRIKYLQEQHILHVLVRKNCVDVVSQGSGLLAIENPNKNQQNYKVSINQHVKYPNDYVPRQFSFPRMYSTKKNLKYKSNEMSSSGDSQRRKKNCFPKK